MAEAYRRFHERRAARRYIGTELRNKVIGNRDRTFLAVLDGEVILLPHGDGPRFEVNILRCHIHNLLLAAPGVEEELLTDKLLGIARRKEHRQCLVGVAVYFLLAICREFLHEVAHLEMFQKRLECPNPVVLRPI